MAARTDIDFFTDESLIEDPYPYYEAARARGPLWQEAVHGAFVVTGYDELHAIYRDPGTFSSINSFGGPFAKLPGGPEQHGDDVTALIRQARAGLPGGNTLSTLDPPDHTAYRGLMMRLLTPRRLQENEAFMWRLADRQIEEFAAHGRCEFLGEYAQPFSLLVIADLLGIPESDHPALREQFLAAGPPAAVGKVFSNDPFAFIEEWFTAYVEDRRRQPRDDVLTHMALATFPDGSTPEVIDVVRAASFLFAGGQGTSARFLGNMMQLLAEDGDHQAGLRKDRLGIPGFIEEALRMKAPVKVNFRMARVSTTLAGVTIPAGSTLMLMVQAGNRDPEHFEDPTTFDIGRANAREHVAFGRGPHSCPGGSLVRADARVTLERFLDRFASIRIAEDEHGAAGDRHYTYSPSWMLRGLETLHLELR